MKATFEMDTEKNLGFVNVSCFDNDGSCTNKMITFEDFLKMIEQMIIDNNEAKEEKYVYNPPQLFKYCADNIPQLLIGKEKGYKKEALFFLPGHRSTLNYLGDIYVVPYPSILFKFTTERGSVVNSYIYAMKEERMEEITDKSILYAFPFGNVYKDGKICWGSINLPKIQQWNDFTEIFELFFGSEVNNDLYGTGRVVPNEKFVQQRGLLEDIKDKMKFPESYLLKQRMVFEELKF